MNAEYLDKAFFQLRKSFSVAVDAAYCLAESAGWCLYMKIKDPRDLPDESAFFRQNLRYLWAETRSIFGISLLICLNLILLSMSVIGFFICPTRLPLADMGGFAFKPLLYIHHYIGGFVGGRICPRRHRRVEGKPHRPCNICGQDSIYATVSAGGSVNEPCHPCVIKQCDKDIRAVMRRSFGRYRVIED